MANDTIRVLLVDDQRVFLEGLQLVLESRTSDIKVVGVALNGADAITLAENHRPDIIIMDVRMPEMSGVEATRIIHERFPDIRILMFTTFDDDEYVHSALQYGAIGYLLKNRRPMELINSLRAVRDGVLQIDPNVAEALLRRDPPSTNTNDEVVRRINTLTGREKEVLHLVAQALDNRHIADHLCVAEQTARNYIHSIYSKLGTSNRMEIVRILEHADFR